MKYIPALIKKLNPKKKHRRKKFKIDTLQQLQQIQSSILFHNLAINLQNCILLTTDLTPTKKERCKSIKNSRKTLMKSKYRPSEFYTHRKNFQVKFLLNM